MADIPLEEARVLVIDDEQSNIVLLERILQRSGYGHVRSTTDPLMALPLFIEFEPDLVLLDLHMPQMDGFEVLEQLREQIPADGYLPILVLTGDVSAAAKQKALANGAKDFLTKPLDVVEIGLRIRNLLHTRFLHLRLQDQNQELAERVRARTRDLELARQETLERLARAAEYRDFDTGKHAQRVGELAALIADALGLAAEQVSLIRQAAPLHDIGKIGVSDSVLLKPTNLTREEFEQMKAHTMIGAGLLSGSRSPLLQLAQEIALYHHERWDGLGYARLKGPETPLAARIVALADVFDALTHARPYRDAWSVEEVVEEIRRQSGKQFDPLVVEAFLRILPVLPPEFFEMDDFAPLGAEEAEPEATPMA